MNLSENHLKLQCVEAFIFEKVDVRWHCEFKKYWTDLNSATKIDCDDFQPQKQCAELVPKEILIPVPIFDDFRDQEKRRISYFWWR